MSPKFNGKGPQKFANRGQQGGRPGPNGKFGGPGPKGKFGGPGPKGKFGGPGPKNNSGPGPRGKFAPKPQTSGPQKRQPKFEDEEFSDESFDDSEASDMNETPDEGIDEQFTVKKAGQKRSLSFANDVNTASSKKGPVQKTPMPSKANGKPQLQNTPLANGKNGKPEDAKKSPKGKPVPEDDDDSEFDSEMDDESFGDEDMGSDEEEDSLMGIDEDSEEDDDDEDGDEKVSPSKKKEDAKIAGAQLRIAGVPKNTPAEKLSSFFASKGFKNVKVAHNSADNCFVATLPSTAEASKMKSSLKGADFMKSKLSLLDYAPAAAKNGKAAQEAPKKQDAKKSKKPQQESSEDEEMDDDDDDEMASFDEEDMSDEELDGEMESFDEVDDDESDDDSAKEKLKKANQIAKTKAEASKTVEKKDQKPAAAVAAGKSDSPLTVVIRGVAKSYEPAKVKSFFEEKGVHINGNVTWDGARGGLVLTVASAADVDKALALRGSKLEKFSLSVSPCGETGAKKEEKGKQQNDGKAEKAESSQNLTVSLKGIPKTFQSQKIDEYLKSKKINTNGAVKFVEGAAGFVVTLKSKADLDAIKNLKGEKIGDKFRFTVTDYAAKAAEPAKAEAKKKPEQKKAKEESDDEESEDELNLGSEDDEEDDDDEEENVQPKAKQQKTEQPAAKATKGDGKEVTLRLSGIPKATPTDKLQDFLKQRGLPSAVVKLQENQLVATVSNTTEADKLRAMNGVRFTSFVIKIEDVKPSQPLANKNDADKSSVPAGQLQFRARLLSIPSDFAVPKLTNLLKGRGVQSVVVTKENGQYIANCQTKQDLNKLLSLKGQKIDDKVRLMVSPIQGDQKQQPQQQQDSRKRAADDTPQKSDSAADSVAAKKPRQVEDSAQQRRQLYVGNIPVGASDEEVRKAFSEATGVRVIRRQGAKKLFAFVTFDSEQTCDLVKNAKDSSGGVKIHGDRVTVDFCGDKSSKFTELQAEKAKQADKKQAEKPKQQSAEKAPEKGKKQDDKKAAASKQEAAPKSKLKTAQSPSKDARVRFADDVDGNGELSEGDMSDDDEDMEGSEGSFDEEGSDFDDEDVSGDDDEDEEDDE